MPFEIVRNDITCMEVDAVVNTAGCRPVVGAGVDLGLNKKAGPRLLEARKEIGYIAWGQAAITPGFDLQAKYVIHAAGPRWFGGMRGERELLRSAYRRALELAVEHGCESVAFPLLSTGNRGVPPEVSMEIAEETFRAFLEHGDIHIYLVVFDRRAFRLSESLFRSVSSYIDEHYVEEKGAEEGIFPAALPTENRRGAGRRAEKLLSGWKSAADVSKYLLPEEDGVAAPKEPSRSPAASQPCPETPPCVCPSAVPSVPDVSAESVALPLDLEAFLKQRDSGFTETLLELIDRSGMKQSEVYRKANVDRRVFSKIVNDKNYRPSKPTAVAFAVALKLDLSAPRDLVERAGYSMTRTNKFDLIIEYCLANQIYDVLRVNEVLFEFDQVLLGNVAK